MGGRALLAAQVLFKLQKNYRPVKTHDQPKPPLAKNLARLLAKSKLSLAAVRSAEPSFEPACNQFLIAVSERQETVFGCRAINKLCRVKVSDWSYTWYHSKDITTMGDINANTNPQKQQIIRIISAGLKIAFDAHALPGRTEAMMSPYFWRHNCVNLHK